MKQGLLVLGLALVAVAAFALDPPKPAPIPAAAPSAAPQDAAAEAPPQDAPPAPEAMPPAAQEAEESLPPLPAGTRSTGPTPQRFDPTEKVRADFPVSFPIDI